MGNAKTKTRKVDDKTTIEWYENDEKLRIAYNKRVKKSQKPSMWEYDPKGGVPTELANLDSSTFSTSRPGQILCSLPRDVLVRICSMLPVCDFFDLSLTCRFLHWKMFTFCTCYAPYTINMSIDDDFTNFRKDKKRQVSPKLIYILNDGDINYEENDNGFRYTSNDSRDEPAVGFCEYPQELDGLRGLFVYQPFCLLKPFFFETLELELDFPFYCKKYYEMCLPYILAVHGLARHLELTFFNYYKIPKNPFYFFDTNDFLATIKASYYQDCYKTNLGDSCDIKYNVDIYLNCPYARQMHRVYIVDHNSQDMLDVPVFQNTIGIHWYPLDDAVRATLDNFLTGSTNLIFHQYLKIEKDNNGYPLIEYLFEEFGEFEGFYCAQQDEKGNYIHYHTWKKNIATENGGLLRILIEKRVDGDGAHLTIGKEEIFDEMAKKYAVDPLFVKGDIWWKMETAVESDEVEEEQGASLACLDLNKVPCPV